MAMTPIRILLFLAGGVVAAGSVAYVAGVFDPYLGPPATIASLPPTQPAPGEPPAAQPPAAQPPAAEAPAQPPATAEQPAQPPGQPATPPAAGETAPAQPPAAAAPTEPTPPAAADAPATQPPAAAPTVQPPSFDLVRAESDGSLVIAGRAVPNAKVEVVMGSRILGSAVAGPEGDFAVVLDEPLKPGDYQIVLRATSPDNVVAMSLETAVISIPQTPDGQVLALVEQPGEPARLITVPEAPKPSEPAPPPAEAATPPATPPAEPPPASPPEVAAAEPAPAPAPVEPAPPAAGEPKVTVEAVEIEGRKIFVAGVADPGRLVRGYANEILLGDSVTSEGGRFLIEAERDLAVGDYIIRVDALGPDGVKVLARAAVPFEREPGENLAAVAPTPPAPGPANPDVPLEGEQSPAKPELPATAAAPAPQPENPPAAAPQPPVAAAEPAPPAAEPAPPASEPAPPAVTETQPAVPAAPEPVAPQPPATAEAPAQPAPPAVAEAPAQPAPPAAEPAPAQPAPPAAEPAPAPADVAAAQPEPAPPETLAPKLQPVDGAVIIRRKDTLWRISKRVYGRGVRYSTIYLANQEQIRDPDRIWPGQVFRVPDKSKEGEPADMKSLGEQAVKVVPYDG